MRARPRRVLCRRKGSWWGEWLGGYEVGDYRGVVGEWREGRG